MAYARKILTNTQLSSNPPPPSGPAGTPNSPEEKDVVVILAALLCAVICLVGLLAVARCGCLRRRIGEGGGGPANKGLKKKVLNSLPKYSYRAEAAEEGGDTAAAEGCPICLGEYGDGDEIRALPQCGHRFHVQCIDTWLASHSSCPSCRKILVVTRCRKCGEYPIQPDSISS